MRPGNPAAAQVRGSTGRRPNKGGSQYGRAVAAGAGALSGGEGAAHQPALAALLPVAPEAGPGDVAAGFGNQLRRESGTWWSTRRWWTQALLWTVLLTGLLAATVLAVAAGGIDIEMALDGLGYFHGLRIDDLLAVVLRQFQIQAFRLCKSPLGRNHKNHHIAAMQKILGGAFMFLKDRPRPRRIHNRHARCTRVGVRPFADAIFTDSRFIVRAFTITDQFNLLRGRRNAHRQQFFAQQGVDEGGFSGVELAHDHEQEELVQLADGGRHRLPVGFGRAKSVQGVAKSGEEVVRAADAPHRLVWWWWEGDEPATRVEFLVVAATMRHYFYVGPETGVGFATTLLRYYTVYFNTHFLFYWGIVGVYSGFLHFRRLRERELHAEKLQRSLTEARLQALPSKGPRLGRRVTKR
mgnify:CR=1 FL=1